MLLMRKTTTNIKKMSDKQLEFCHKQTIFLTWKYKQVAKTSLSPIALKTMSLLLRVYNEAHNLKL